MLNGLALVLVGATVAVMVLYVAIAADPTGPFNPFPPPTALPSPTALPEPGTPEGTVLVLGSLPIPSPTPLRPATLTPTPEPVFPFTVMVETGPVGTGLACRAMIVGSVADGEGRGLEGYPLHLWAAEAEFASAETVLFSDAAGRWQVLLPAEARGMWYIQLHAPDSRQIYPPLSPVVVVVLPATCPQARVTFRAMQPFPSHVSP